MNNNIKLVNQQLKNAYAPYSNFHVACLIITTDDTYIYGVNVENASYGATICAERSALTTFATQGYRMGDIKELYITSQMDEITPPCGVCRQFMTEFVDSNTKIIMTCVTEKYKITNIDELVPYSFTKKDLNV